MIRWLLRILFLAVLVGGCLFGYERVLGERVCYDTNKCEERIRGLNVQLEFHSNDRVLEIEKKGGRTSERRAFYPASLDAIKAEGGSGDNTVCPIYGVKYRYIQLEGGTSYLAYCPARHQFHFADQPFVNAITPDRERLHLYLSGGRVYTIAGEHPNPWDFHTPMRVDESPMPLDSKNPTFAVLATDLPADLIQMLSENPPRVTRF